MADEPTTGDNVAEAAPTTADALTPPVNDGFNRIDPSVENVSDIDGIPVKEGETKPAEAKADAKGAEDKSAKADDPDRFDKHPRFQELIKDRDTLRQELASIKGKLEVLTPKETAEAKAEPLPFIDITTKSKEELLEWQEDDPKGYAANLYRQMLHETRQTLKAEQAQLQKTTSVQQTYANFEKENPDFREKWNSGEIQKFMEAHPGHNAISAHMALTEKSRVESEKAKVDAAVAKAVKEAEERVTKNFQAKRNAQVISEGGAIKEIGTPDELKHPDKYGGPTATLALRLERLRQAAAGG